MSQRLLTLGLRRRVAARTAFTSSSSTARMTCIRRAFSGQASTPATPAATVASATATTTKNHPSAMESEFGESKAIPNALPGMERLDPAQERNVQLKNYALAVTLFGFVMSVYVLSSKAVHKNPDSLELEDLYRELLEEKANKK
jgi:hypothetical protein